MVKKILISIVSLLLFCRRLTVLHLDSIVKSGVEVAGPSVVGAAVTVNSVSLSPLSGQGRLRNILNQSSSQLLRRRDTNRHRWLNNYFFYPGIADRFCH